MTKKLGRNPAAIIAPIIVIVAVLVGIKLFSGEANGQSAEAPSTITAQQAEAALRQVVPNVTVEAIAPSPIDGIWEMVVITPQGKRIAYIDVKGKYLLSGSLIELATGTDVTRERFADLNRVDFASIPLHDAIVMGNPNAAKKVVVFDDPD